MSEKTEHNVLAIAQKDGETEAQAMARAVASPTCNATAASYQLNVLSGVGGCVDINALQNEIGKHVLDVRDGIMSRPEAFLVAQAHTLDTMFNTLVMRATKNLAAGYLNAGETYLRLALKAQSQCRTTVEAIAEIKNPTKPTFIKQQNVAHNQQVNNGVPGDSRSSTHAHAHERNINPTNELLEASDGERLDFGATGATGSANQDLAAVGSVDRAED